MPSRRRLLRAGALGLLAAAAGCSARRRRGDERTTDDRPGTDARTIDDWQYDPDGGDRGAAAGGGGSGGGGGPGAGTPQATATAGSGASYDRAAESADVGLAAGGAKDVNNFRQNVSEGYLPLPTDVSYEGLFYDYYFDTGDPGDCETLFCPTYSPAVTADPLSEVTERYFTVGLNSNISIEEFDRKPLNLAVVVDTSGSMSSGFGEYYYDRQGNKREVEEPNLPKMEVAAEAIADLTRQLRPEDRFGIVTFDRTAQVAKPLRRVEETDMEAIRGHLPELQAGGGTRMSAGIDLATEMLSEYGDDPRERETRTIVLTDAMPNLGDTSEGGLRGRLADNAEQNRYTTFVGVGVDFNSRIVDAITEVRGANYYSVRSPDQFQRRLGEQFKYMVTPLVFDLSLEVQGEGFELERVYGTTAAEESTGELLRANTLFASPTDEEGTRGGVILAKVRATAGGEVTLRASWEDRAGEESSTETTVQFPAGGPEQFDSTGVRKAVLLSRYADLLKSWAIDTRERSGRPREEGIRVPEETGQWERQSTPLSVSPAYREKFRSFAAHFESEMNALDDEDLGQELEILQTLANYEGDGDEGEGDDDQRRLSASVDD